MVMEAVAYQVLKVGELGTLVLSWTIMFVSGAAAVALVKKEFRLRRPVYFLSVGLIFFTHWSNVLPSPRRK